MTMQQIQCKKQLRDELRKTRSLIAAHRRIDASQKALVHLKAVFENHSVVLSYSSIGDELCTREINQYLVSQKKLALPRVVGDEIKVYSVRDLESLQKSSLGIMEPNEELCEELPTTSLSFVLVPAIGFDANDHRIGYGAGYYDRFLAGLPQQSLFVGIGYKEQLSAAPIPIDPTDVALSAVLLF